MQRGLAVSDLHQYVEASTPSKVLVDEQDIRRLIGDRLGQGRGIPCLGDQLNVLSRVQHETQTSPEQWLGIGRDDPNGLT